jgi:AraC-like DNA-binding protein
MARKTQGSQQDVRRLAEARLRTLAARRPARALFHAPAQAGPRPRGPETDRRHIATQYEIVFVVRGAAVVKTPSRAFELTPGQILLIDPGVDHSEAPASRPSAYEAFWLGIEGTTARLDGSIFTSRPSFTIGPRLLLEGNTDVESIAAAISAEMRSRELGWVTSVNSLLTYLSTILIRRLRRLSERPVHRVETLTVSADPSVWRAIRRAVTVCEANLAKPLRVADVAAAVGYSPNHLSRLFARYLGSSFSSYMQNLRMTSAKNLLASRDLSISEIARALGYSDPTNFSHAFARATGSSPRTYRRHLCAR